MSFTGDPADTLAVQASIRALAVAREIELSSHAQPALQDDGFTTADLRAALVAGIVLENYHDARRGPCCLMLGFATDGRPLHAVVTTTQPRILTITVYEPTPPKWSSGSSC